MDAQKEIRKAEIQSASGRTVSGYAVRFETESVNMGFVEITQSPKKQSKRLMCLHC